MARLEAIEMSHVKRLIFSSLKRNRALETEQRLLAAL
jgi:hypothetical protein